MARESTGVLLKRRGYFAARIWIGDKRPVLAMHASLDEGEATERARELASMATRLRDAGMVADAERALAIAARSRPGEEWGNAREMIDALCSGSTTEASDVPTIGTFADMWIDGTLAKRYPDHVKEKRTSDRDEQRFRLYINPVIGPVRVDRFELRHADAVMAKLPRDMAAKTRKQVGQALHRLITMAVYPARHLAANPIPRGWLPGNGRKRAKSYLHPAEDARLLGCALVPLRDRLFYGFLAREGCRRGEALAMRWTDFDLDAGSVRLDENKTDDPRAWALDPGVARALRTWKARRRELEPALSDADFARQRVFLDDAGHVTESNELRAGDFRVALRKAGITRAELFEDNDVRQQVRVHDLRATFITLALANGRTEAWVADRTGHRSSTMINEYRRAARTHAELNLGTLAPLDDAIPELRDAEKGAQGDGAQGDAGKGDAGKGAQGDGGGKAIASKDTRLDTGSVASGKTRRPHGDLNPGYRRERPMS